MRTCDLHNRPDRNSNLNDSNDSRFTFQSLHWMATFVRNCYPNVQEVCEVFNDSLRTLIQKESMPEMELGEWSGTIDDRQDAGLFGTALKNMGENPDTPDPWVTIDKCSDENIAILMDNFMQLQNGEDT